MNSPAGTPKKTRAPVGASIFRVTFSRGMDH
jgi:hypothetical protein